MGIEPIPLSSRSGTAAPQGVRRPISSVGLPAVILFVLVLGLLQRDAKVPKDCVIHGVPTRSLGTDGPRLRHRTCPNKSQSVPIQSSGLPRALLNVGAHIHVPPLRKAASYSFIIRVAAVEEQFPVGPAKGDAAAQFPQVFPTRMIRSRRQIVFLFGGEPVALGTGSLTSAPKGIWRSIFALGLPGVFLFVLVLGLLQRDAEVPKDCVIHGVPTRSLGIDGPRLPHQTCPNNSQSVPIQSSGLPRALLNVGAHIHVPPMRKAASYSFIIRVAADEEQFPAGPQKGQKATQPRNFIRSFPPERFAVGARSSSNLAGAVFVCPLYVHMDYFRIGGDPSRPPQWANWPICRLLDSNIAPSTQPEPLAAPISAPRFLDPVCRFA